MSMDQQAGMQPGNYQGRRQPSMGGMAPQQQQQQQFYESSPGPSSEPAASETKSPLSNMGLGFLRGLGDRKTKDGKEPKKRGPKPNEKPATSRRQELNRQAQRTHRQRKEYYIKSLEHEVMQLREVYTGTIQQKNDIEKENERLKELLRLHGISFNGGAGSVGGHQGSLSLVPPGPGSTSDAGYAAMSQASLSPLTQTRFHAPSASPDMFAGSQYSNTPVQQGAQPPQAQQQPQRPSQSGQAGLDYDQLGVDFVLALEAACTDHLQYMCVRSTQDTADSPNGHAMMMSCPPPSHIAERPDEPYPHQAPKLPASDLNRLLELAQTLEHNDGEITPIIALHLIRTHPRFTELSRTDLELIKGELKGKTRCYGFGAVLEEFELRDALASIFSTKPESYAVFNA